MSFGFGFGFTKITAAIRAAFSPSSLFAANEPGVWYDPSDLSTMFQDSAGTTPVTAVEQPVGLMLDKSKGLALGPELVTNGDFSDGLNGWSNASTGGGSVSVVNGQMRMTGFNSAGNRAVVDATIPTVAGKRYRVVFNRTVVSGAGIVELYVGTTVGGATLYNQNTSFTSGSFLANDSTTYLRFRSGGAVTIDFDNISVRELPGNHAYQTTATSRPVLSARYNLLTNTEQFDNSVWAKTNVTVTPNAAVAPDGTVTADRVTTSATDGLVYLPTYANSYPQPITFSVCAKADASSSLTIQFTSSGNGRGATFDLNAGTCTAVVAIGTGTGVSGGVSSIAALGGNWYRCTISNISVTDLRFPVFNVVGPSNSSIYIWGASLVPANQASLPYQRVNTATDYDTAGFPHYLRFDGVDDWLVTNAITPGTDKAQVFAGVRKLSDAASDVLVELSSNFNTNMGGFVVSVTDGANTRFSAAMSNAGNSYNAAYYTDSAAPLTTVNTVTLDKALSSNEITAIRKNGADQSLTRSYNSNTTGNFLAYPLYIGRRGGTSPPFNGHLYSLIVRFGPNLPAATIENTEKYINTKTGAY